MADAFEQYKKAQLRDENDFSVEEMKLIAYNGAEYDIVKLYQRFHVIEDLFGNFVVGSVIIFDSIDLPQLMPLIGEEKITISLTRPLPPPDIGYEDPYKMTFRVYKMEARQTRGDKGKQSYTLHFCSPEMLTQNKTKIRKTYKGKKYSEIVSSVYDEFIKIDKNLVVSDTKSEQHYVASNYTPIETINAVASRSTSPSDNSSYYLFYETSEEFRFESLADMIEKDPIEEIYYGPHNVHKESYGDTGTLGPRSAEPERQIKNAQEYIHTASFDVLKDQAVGKFNSKLITYDPIRMIWKDDYDFDYDDQFNEFTHLADKKPFTADLDVKGDPMAHIKLLRTDLDHDSVSHITAHEPGILPYRPEEYVQKRTSQLHQINEVALLVSISGDPKIHVGQTISFLLPEQRGMITKENPRELDKYLSGKFLIVGVKHRLEKNGYWLDLRIVKDAFVSDIEHIDPIEEVRPDTEDVDI